MGQVSIGDPQMLNVISETDSSWLEPAEDCEGNPLKASTTGISTTFKLNYVIIAMRGEWNVDGTHLSRLRVKGQRFRQETAVGKDKFVEYMCYRSQFRGERNETSD